ncbi:DegT/DnrJ/EryC1/StrS family aminotransferase [uncultured Paraglaciecola sp.]|uniref:DegT/DnrJ/EryC1/StrS family aminotransferase n=1 Tax=uncultured Paraglaciecola sp. TaxID=1765024 RepID=UPI0025CC9A55|nr:DegT/DnrJ/EryC1/StrS family aminotransferase [uncultured Paraglaciecola sp.]
MSKCKFDRQDKEGALAILGGERAIDKLFMVYNSLGKEEKQAAIGVLETGVLSQFIGGWHEHFYGGPKVREFERACETYFDIKHAVTFNSLTSGLISAVGAIGLEPGDEVIVSPWTMCASATAILHWNAIPVFADIETETFNLDLKSVEANISPYTKAIIAVDIFGHPVDMDALMTLAEKYNLKIISDTAQAPSAFYKEQYAGTLADIGGYSLNYHKHIHTGEGGIMVTNDDEYAEKMRLIRNHAEAVVGSKGETDLVNMVGYNFRLGEIESAIGIEQLKKLPDFVMRRQIIAEQLSSGLKNLLGLRTPIIKPNCTHAYYVYPILLNIDLLGVSRQVIFDALDAEGVSGLIQGYVNLHLLPMYQRKIAYGKKGFPWTAEFCKRNVNYDLGVCPVAEQLHRETFLGYQMCLYELTDDDVQLVIYAFKKVWSNLGDLSEYEKGR